MAEVPIAVRLMLRIADPDEPTTAPDEHWDQRQKNLVEAVYRMFLHTTDLAIQVAMGTAAVTEHTRSTVLLGDACRRAVRALGEDAVVAAIRQRMDQSRQAELAPASDSQRQVMSEAADLLARAAATASGR